MSTHKHSASSFQYLFLWNEVPPPPPVKFNILSSLKMVMPMQWGCAIWVKKSLPLKLILLHKPFCHHLLAQMSLLEDWWEMEIVFSGGCLRGSLAPRYYTYMCVCMLWGSCFWKGECIPQVQRVMTIIHLTKLL